MRRARKNGGRLQLTPEQFRQFQKQMAELQLGFAASKEIQEWGERVFKSYEPVVESARRSVFPVIVDDRQVALATAVDRSGLLVTKASEIQDKEFQIALEDKPVGGTLVKAFDDYDLALIRVQGVELTPVQWAKTPLHVKLGTFVAVVSKETQPEAIGVVSVMARGLQPAFLGVYTQSAANGIELVDVLAETPADVGGLKKGDVVLSLNGKAYKTTSAFAIAISEHAPGDTVRLRVRRGDRELTLEVKLGDRSSVARMPGMMDQLGGRLSKRRSEFKRVIQHDCPMDPEDCGGPLVDLDGRAIGINIARAGRIKSYAVSADTVQRLLAR
jgi:serine protease Do